MSLRLSKRLRSPGGAFSTRIYTNGARMTREAKFTTNYFSDSF
jgi:hypothetical protein